MALDLSPIWISLETSVTATAITLVLGVAVAIWRANRRGPGPALLDGVFLLPLVLPPTVVSFPLMYLSVRAALEQVDTHLLQAARTLGASEWRVFRRVELPLAWPGILAGTILAFARALGEFGATLMLAGSIPGRTQTIPIAIYFAVEANDLHQAAAWSLIDISISLTMIAGMYYWAHLRSPERTQWSRR